MIFGEGVLLTVPSFWFADKSGHGTSGKPFLKIRILGTFLPLFDDIQLKNQAENVESERGEDDM